MALPTILTHGDPSTRFRLTTGVVTASTVTQTIQGTDRYGTMLLFLDVTAASGTSPTMDIRLQTLMPDQTTWTDIAAFAQVTSTAQRYMSLTSGGAGVESAIQAGALAAGTFKNIVFGEAIRLKYTIGGTNPSFTHTVYALLTV